MTGPEPTLERSDWVARLRKFVEAGPDALPASETLFDQNAADVSGVVLPLVARRNLKRLLRASLELNADAEVMTRWSSQLSALLSLSDAALETLLVRPEVTGLLAAIEDNPDDGRALLPWLGQVVVGAVAAAGADLEPTEIVRSTPSTVSLPAAGLVGTLSSSGDGPVVATVRGGRVTLAGADVEWHPHPIVLGHVGLSTGRNAWLEQTFRGVEQVPRLDAEGVQRFTGELSEAAAVLKGVWPEAHGELLALLRWVVPLASNDSWYVPGMHGLVALGLLSGRRLVRDLFHETGHHKLSRILELASATRNPDHRVFSVFAKGKEPITSLLQSCWSFSREYELIQRLKASGYLEPDAVAREELKFRVLFDKGIPVLRREAQLTAMGDAVLTCIEESIR